MTLLHETEEEIRNHLATFPDRREHEAKRDREWDEFKNRMFWMLIAGIASVLSIGVWVGIMQTHVEQIMADHAKIDVKTTQFDDRLGQLEVNNGEIRTRLSSIDSTLQEIKISIRQLKIY